MCIYIYIYSISLYIYMLICLYVYICKVLCLRSMLQPALDESDNLMPLL